LPSKRSPTRTNLVVSKMIDLDRKSMDAIWHLLKS